jgi:hypothetical protein
VIGEVRDGGNGRSEEHALGRGVEEAVGRRVDEHRHVEEPALLGLRRGEGRSCGSDPLRDGFDLDGPVS